MIRVEPYGVLLDVGANRDGLLHIQQVSQFFQRYIDKEEGLKREAGLERGARGVLQVLSNNNKKRLLLDFTKEAKREVKELRKEERKKKRKTQMKKNTKQVGTNRTQPSSTGRLLPLPNPLSRLRHVRYHPKKRLHGTPTQLHKRPPSHNYPLINQEYHEEDDEEYADDDYDEDREIEDALVLGTPRCVVHGTFQCEKIHRVASFGDPYEQNP